MLSHHVLSSGLFTDAKVHKNGVEHLGGGDFAHDVGEVVKALAEVFTHQVAGEADREPFGHANEVGMGSGEGLVVAGVADDGQSRGGRRQE